MRRMLRWLVPVVLAATMFSSCPFKAGAQGDPTAAKQDLVQGLNEYTIGSLYKPLILKTVISFEMSPAWWARMNDKDQKGLHALSFATPDLNEFAKRMRCSCLRKQWPRYEGRMEASHRECAESVATQIQFVI